MSYEPYRGKPPCVATSETSKAASASMRMGSRSLREIIRDAMLVDWGLTCDEVEELLHIKHQTASARIRELALTKRIEPIGGRPTRSGRKAVVWRAIIVAAEGVA